MGKERLDVFLFENGYAKSRTAAQALIMEGIVYVDNQKAMKAGDMVSGTEKIEVRGKTLEYVSRGGLKLEKAMKSFNISLQSLVCMDIGASTGGFTDCMLKNGAVKVYSVDVGYGQLAWTLRQDERVVNMERTNIRYVERKDIDDDLDFFSVDVSFISLKKVLPVAYNLLKENGKGACLIKPQFEAGRAAIGKGGIVKSKSDREAAVFKVLDFANSMGLICTGLIVSPITGGDGNTEYLAIFKKKGDPIARETVKKIVGERK